jgi:hypothetical protein
MEVNKMQDQPVNGELSRDDIRGAARSLMRAQSWRDPVSGARYWMMPQERGAHVGFQLRVNGEPAVTGSENAPTILSGLRWLLQRIAPDVTVDTARVRDVESALLAKSGPTPIMATCPFCAEACANLATTPEACEHFLLTTSEMVRGERMTFAYFLIDEELTQCVRCDYWNDLDAKSCRNCREVL